MHIEFPIAEQVHLPAVYSTTKEQIIHKLHLPMDPFLPRSSRTTTTSTRAGPDIAHQAQEAREARERIRVEDKCIRVIQRRVRGFLCRRAVMKELQTEMQKKAQDLVKLVTTFVALKREFVCPKEHLTRMMEIVAFLEPCTLKESIDALAILLIHSWINVPHGNHDALLSRFLLACLRVQNLTVHSYILQQPAYASMIANLVITGHQRDALLSLCNSVSSSFAIRTSALTIILQSLTQQQQQQQQNIGQFIAIHILPIPWLSTTQAQAILFQFPLLIPSTLQALSQPNIILNSDLNMTELDRTKRQVYRFASLVVMLRQTLHDPFALPALLCGLHHVPYHAFVGANGVSWHKTLGTLNLDTPTLEALDNLSSQLVPAFTSNMLKPNSSTWDVFMQVDVNEWSTVNEGDLASEALPSLADTKRVTMWSVVKDAFSSSTWAKRLGLSSSSTTTAAAPPPTPMRKSSQPAPSPPARITTLPTSRFDVPDKARLWSRCMAVFFTRWPPISTNPRSQALLSTLTFSTDAFKRFWGLVEESKRDLPEWNELAFTAVLIGSHLLCVTDSEELFDGSFATRSQLNRVVSILNRVVFDALKQQQQQPPSKIEPFKTLLVQRTSRFLAQLYSEHSRRPLVRAESWLLNGIAKPADFDLVCNTIPWALTFSERAKIFRTRVQNLRADHQPENEPPEYRMRVRRKYLLEDSISLFLRADLRKRIYVVFTNDLGLDEAGIDARGLFKEFLTMLSEDLFNPARGLFVIAKDGDGALYPNPLATLLHGSFEAPRLFEFAGRVLGKALYEGVVIQPQLSFFVLAKLLRKIVTISDLAALDSELHKNLVFLKNYDGDVRDLGLTFAINSDAIAGSKEIELFPGGSKVEVTSRLKFRYVNLISHYKLNVEGKDLHEAFLRGVRAVLPDDGAGSWLQCFSERELQVLISGVLGEIDVKDWRACTQYAGGYFGQAKQIQWFWEIVEQDFTEQQRGMLLRFATSCSRQPLLGFSELRPPFTVQRAGGGGNGVLPTSATCFNTLKLPAYDDKKIMKEKLTLAITSGAGFELT